MSYDVPPVPGEETGPPQERDAPAPAQERIGPPLWEVFVRAERGLDHVHVGSVHASDASSALLAARDVYTRRAEGVSIWVVPSTAITAADPDDAGDWFDDPKPYRHPTFYQIPDDVGHM